MRTLHVAALSYGLTLLGCKHAPKTETLLVAGSSTMRSYMDTVVKGFVAGNPSVSIVNEGGGSTAAMVALQHGAIDIASVARTITAKEDDLYTRATTSVARDGIAIVVNLGQSHRRHDRPSSSPASSVAISKHAPPSAGKRSPSSCSTASRPRNAPAIRSKTWSWGGDELASRRCKVQPGSAEMIAAVRSTPGAIGYAHPPSLGARCEGSQNRRGVEMSRPPTMLQVGSISARPILLPRGALATVALGSAVHRLHVE